MYAHRLSRRSLGVGGFVSMLISFPNLIDL